MRRLAPGNAAFLQKLIGGQCLAAAVAAAFDAAPVFDLPGAIGEMIAAGTFSHIEMESGHVERI